MIKQIALFMLVLILLPCSLADGFVQRYDQDMWGLLSEEKQIAAINYKSSTQRLILGVNLDEDSTADRIAWIFPVPSQPEDISINIVKGFPRLLGYNLEDEVDEAIMRTFALTRLSQIVSFPLIFFTGRIAGFQGVTVHESIEEMGLTTELVSATDGKALAAYFEEKDVELNGHARELITEYVGDNYSFVISWISDLDDFKRSRDSGSGYDRVWTSSTIGVSVSFPTDSIYYPLKLTSVYGKTIVPTIIYVMEYVEPIIYEEIEADTKTDYFFERRFIAQDDLKDFFMGYDMTPRTIRGSHAGIPGFEIESIKYTKISINASSDQFTEDLWMEDTTPPKVKIYYLINRYWYVFSLLFLVLFSCIASFLSGMITFREERISRLKLTLLGLSNLLTIIGFTIATYFVRTTEVPKKLLSKIQAKHLVMINKQQMKYKIMLVYFMSLIFLLLSISSLLFRSFISFILLLTVFVYIILLLFVFFFILINEELTSKYKTDLTRRGIQVKIINLKKLAFILIYNTLLLFVSFFFKLHNRLADFFDSISLFEEYTPQGNMILLVLLTVFASSIVIVALVDKSSWRRIMHGGYYILRSDSRKIKFVILFSIIFLVLTAVLQAIMHLMF